MANDQRELQTQKTAARRGIGVFEGLIYALLSWTLANQLGLTALIPVLREVNSAPVVVAIFGGVVGLTRGVVLLRILVGCVLCFWLIVGYTPLASHLVTPLKVEQTPEKADAVVVLQAGIQKDNDFGAYTLERTLHAVELVRQGYAPRLIVTETTSDPAQESHEKAASNLMKNLRVSFQLLSIGPVHNTHDEAVRVSELAGKNGWKKILLVTSPTHSKRAYFTFSKTGLEVISSPCRESMFDFENINDMQADGRIRAFAQMLREVLGLRTYRARGWA